MITIKNYKKFSVFFAINVILLILANTFMPANYTLGNNLFSPLMAALFTGFVWNYVVWHTQSFLKSMDIDLKGKNNMMIAYLASNFVSIWLLARFAFATGFGVSNWFFALSLAILANVIQYAAWNAMTKKK